MSVEQQSDQDNLIVAASDICAGVDVFGQAFFDLKNLENVSLKFSSLGGYCSISVHGTTVGEISLRPELILYLLQKVEKVTDPETLGTVIQNAIPRNKMQERITIGIYKSCFISRIEEVVETDPEPSEEELTLD